MYIIIGGTGHIGSVVTEELLNAKQSVTVVSRNADKAENLKLKGAKVAVCDVCDKESLHNIFLAGERLFLLNPPADPSTDTVAEELRTLNCILDALKNTPIKKVVAESTYGAQPGKGKGDLNVLYDMEQALSKSTLSVSIIRAAYYMSNWDMYVPVAEKDGTLPTLFPENFKIPMVAPADIGKIAANLLQAPIEESSMHYVEGPSAYSPGEVARAFSNALGKQVKTVSTPRSQWKEALESVGFSKKAAASYAAMTAVTLDEQYEKPENPMRGKTTIEEYIANLVAQEFHYS